ncbi:MAG TPA: hypothetical protein VHC42_05550 [Rhizomicrobium sp.]|nr:hypothetical protein [Rhizomicrobium sp.]
MREKPTVWLATDVGQSFGLVGALIDAGMQESREDKMWTMLAGQKMYPRDQFMSALRQSLEADGFAVKTIDIAREAGKYVKAYPPGAENGVDAYFDIVVDQYGYVAAGIASSTPYRPYVYLNCKLVQASNGAVLMQDSIYYDPVAPFGQGKNVSISPDPAYTFVDFDALESEPQKGAEGLTSAFHATSDSLGRLLR